MKYTLQTRALPTNSRFLYYYDSAVCPRWWSRLSLRQRRAKNRLVSRRLCQTLTFLACHLNSLYKPETKWTNNQWLRMSLLFDRYPKLKKAYEHAQKLRYIYELDDRESAGKALFGKESHADLVINSGKQLTDALAGQRLGLTSYGIT